MKLEGLVKHIKDDGCRVYLYKSKKYIHGSSATFDIADRGPLISVATKGEKKKKIIEALLHEYGHYLQWKDGTLQMLEGICDAYEIYDKWIARKIELDDAAKIMARNVMLSIEWDAEMRACKLGKQLKVETFSPIYHLMGANAYIATIKWSWANRRDTRDCIKRVYMQPKQLTWEEVFAPLSDKENIKIGRLLVEKVN